MILQENPKKVPSYASYVRLLSHFLLKTVCFCFNDPKKLLL